MGRSALAPRTPARLFRELRNARAFRGDELSEAVGLGAGNVCYWRFQMRHSSAYGLGATELSQAVQILLTASPHIGIMIWIQFEIVPSILLVTSTKLL
jgi:hypothetical protein